MCIRASTFCQVLVRLGRCTEAKEVDGSRAQKVWGETHEKVWREGSKMCTALQHRVTVQQNIRVLLNWLG